METKCFFLCGLTIETILYIKNTLTEDNLYNKTEGKEVTNVCPVSGDQPLIYWE